ncbi:hypothetical protein EsH8_II_000927 [Colletotrichum jinshuiense]
MEATHNSDKWTRNLQSIREGSVISSPSDFNNCSSISHSLFPSTQRVTDPSALPRQLPNSPSKRLGIPSAYGPYLTTNCLSQTSIANQVPLLVCIALYSQRHPYTSPDA